MRKNSGFTLIEVIVVLFFMSFVFLALGAHVTMTMSADLQSRLATEASNLLQDKMETLKKVQFDVLSPGSDSVTVYGVAFNRSWTVSNLDTLKKIDLIIQYGSKSVRLTTLRSRDV